MNNSVGQNKSLAINSETLAQEILRTQDHKPRANHSKIKHGDYFVGVNYSDVNPHNVEAIYPKGFPFRTGTDFLKYNKQYEETHSFRKSLNSEIVNQSG